MKVSQSDEEILKDFAGTYPYSKDELMEMLSKGKVASTATGLIAHLKKSLKKEDY